MARPRAGLLIIRAWIEPGSSSPLRAQVRIATDVSEGFEASRTMTREEAVIEAVQSWLSGMLAGAGAIDGDTDPPKPSR